MSFYSYQSLLSTHCKKQWQRFGTTRRAGVATPLFSLFSEKSVGIGEIPDLKLLVDWCEKTHLSIIQLLPLNDTGFDFRPYDAQSMFALDPMYLSLSELAGVSSSEFRSEISDLRNIFSLKGKKFVNYGIKRAKLQLLWNIFQTRKEKKPKEFTDFLSRCHFWLDRYALYKALKDHNEQKSWVEWPPDWKEGNEQALRQFENQNEEKILFYKWLQWQLFEQMREVKRYANEKGIFLMGDIPFLVSRDSADVWEFQNYFKLNLASGAPPDFYFSKGQRWGMPPYEWSAIAQKNFDYVKEKLKWAENFYDLFRIDHAVGLYRVWTIALSEPEENAGLHGQFDPPHEAEWEAHGRNLFQVMSDTSMLACAEDLGVVPACSNRVLEEFGIPGMEVQRWVKDWGKSYDFKAPQEYRSSSIAVLSTHDSTTLRNWWELEAGTVDGELFKRKCAERGIHYDAICHQLFDFEKSHHGRLRWKAIHSTDSFVRTLGKPESEVADLIDLFKGTYEEKRKFWFYLGLGEPFQENADAHFFKKVFERISQTASIFSIHLLQDWLSLDPQFQTNGVEDRINFPGRMRATNWALLMPYALEDMKHLSVNSIIKQINTQAERK